MNRMLWWPATLAVATMLACGGGNDSSTDPGGRDAITDPGLMTDPGTDEGRPDTGKPDTGTDTGPECTCNTTDNCCNGCLPINEGGACGETGNCLVPGTCQAGACAGGGPLACDNPGPCQEEGTCDQGSGTCVYPDRPDQAPCEGVEGLAGSGMCLDGVCYDFGRCDHRTYGQPSGYACNFDGECAEGWCQEIGDDWSAFCTRRCGVGMDPCPEGMACVTDGEGTTDMHCRPLNKDLTLPGDGTMPMFAVCNRNEDCEGGLCLSSSGKRFCTGDCGSDGAADTAICGTCGECRDNGDELSFDFKFYCMPKGSNAIGEPCGMSADCKIAFCQGGQCSGQCVSLGDGVSSCPNDMACVTGLFNDPSLFVCVPWEQADRALGDTCAEDWSCVEGVCREYLGENRCMTVCTEENPCAEGETCQTVGSAKLCVSDEAAGVVTAGAACTYAFQCVEGAACYGNTCIFGCDTEADCDEGTCFLDAMFRAAYCTNACTTDDDCPERMQCVGEACVLSAEGNTYLFGACRGDRDCETGNCASGSCTVECASEAPCEGSLLPTWDAVHLCAPCDPRNFGSECNDGGWGFNECVEGPDSAFCAPECGIRGAGICPVGTRCYNIDGYTEACVPLTGSCMITSACGGDGACLRPVGEGMPCTEDIQCAGERCANGRCLSATCVEDEDCGCDLLVCGGDTCEIGSEAGILEVEPNDDLDDAQVLGTGQTTVIASLMATAGVADVDLFKVHLDQGQALDVITEPFCGQNADTFLRLVAGDGTPLPGWENDDIDPNGWFFSWLNGFVAESAMDVYIEVVQSPYVAGFARFNYLLSVHVFTVADNSTCDDAISLEEGTSYHDLATALDNYHVASCTGNAAPGKDMAFHLTIPAWSSLEVTIDAPFDAQLILVDDCENADESCFTGADDVWAPGIETLLWANPTDMPVDGYLIVDSFYTSGDSLFELSLAYQAVEAPPYDVAGGALEMDLEAPMSLSLLGAGNDYNAGDWSCEPTVALPGPDIVLRTEFAPGDFGLFQVKNLVGKMPYLVLVADPDGPSPECLASGRGVVQWLAGDDPKTVYLVIDESREHDYARFDLHAQRGPNGGPLGQCFGPCDPTSWTRTCIGDPASLCLCDGTTRALTPFSCNDYCVGEGALSGACYTFTAPKYEGDSCMCNFDCSLPNDHCTESIYTNCSCGAADPCGWKDNGYCNEFCEVEYPGDFFDDTLDCTPAP